MRKNAEPQLRFPLYDSNWAIRKLKDVAPLQRGFDLPTTNVIEGKYPVVYSNGIGRYHNEFKAKAPGIVTGRSGTIGALTYVEKDYWPHNTSLWVTDFIDCTPKFVFYLYQKIDLKRFATGSGVPTLNRNDVHDFRAHIPELNEQQKIADFLTSVDSKISQLTEKHRLLKEYKKGVMQQIFSQQIRFKDEDGKAFPEWELKTIGDIMTESRIKGSGGDKAKKLTVKIWGKGVIAKKEDVKGSENTQYYKRRAGQFIYGKLDFLNCAFAIIPSELDGLESTLDLPALDVTPLVNKYFVLEVIKQKWFYKRFGDIADGSRKAKRINVNVFQEMPIRLPMKSEQDKIMLYLQSIDNKIDAVAEQIEQTKQFKKGLLQQMFV